MLGMYLPGPMTGLGAPPPVMPPPQPSSAQCYTACSAPGRFVGQPGLSMCRKVCTQVWHPDGCGPACATEFAASTPAARNTCNFACHGAFQAAQPLSLATLRSWITPSALMPEGPPPAVAEVLARRAEAEMGPTVGLTGTILGKVVIGGAVVGALYLGYRLLKGAKS